MTKMNRNERRIAGLLVAIAVALCTGFVAASWIKIGSAPFLPLDDSFIYLRYAQRLAAGNWYSYSEGGPFTTGSTSPLYPWLLVPIFWMGVSGTATLLAPLAWGFVWASAGALLLYQLGRRLQADAAPWAAAALSLCTGYWLHGCMSGMETSGFAVVMLMTIWCAARWIDTHQSNHLMHLALVAGTLPLWRPEGMPIAVFLVVWLVVQSRKRPADVIVPAAIILLPGVLWMLNVRVLSGTFETNGLQLKGVLANTTALFLEKVAYSTRSLATLITDFYANRPQTYFTRDQALWIHPPLLVPLAVVGAVGVVRDAERRAVGIVAIGMLLVGVGITLLIEPYDGHGYRYQLPYQPLWLLFYAHGLAVIARAAALPAAGLAVAALLGPLSGVPWWMMWYAENGSDIHNQHRTLSWRVPEEAKQGQYVVGFTDVGVIPYYNPALRVYDYAGLVTNGAARDLRAGLGSAYEAIERVPQAERPMLNIGYGHITGEPGGNSWIGTLVTEAWLLRNTVAGGGRKIVCVAPWATWTDVVSDKTQPPGTIHDPRIINAGDDADSISSADRVHAHLDLADLVSESTAAYAFALGKETPGPQFGTIDSLNVYLMQRDHDPAIPDGGRVAPEHAWTWSASLSPESPARLILRLSSVPSPCPYTNPAAWTVEIHDNVGLVAHGYAPLSDPLSRERFLEASLPLTIERDSIGPLRVIVRADKSLGDFGALTLYYAWLVSPE